MRHARATLVRCPMLSLPKGSIWVCLDTPRYPRRCLASGMGLPVWVETLSAALRLRSRCSSIWARYPTRILGFTHRLPASGCSSPANSLIMVVLPLPLGPTKAIFSPGDTEKQASFMTWGAPGAYLKQRSRALRMVFVLWEPSWNFMVTGLSLRGFSGFWSNSLSSRRCLALNWVACFLARLLR